jgi:hypothetical protein
MAKMLKGKFLPVVCLIICGCASYHGGTDLSKLDEFPIVVNQTTRQELVARFGKPQHTVTESDGKAQLIWTDSTARAGAFSGSNTKTKMLFVTLTNDVVVDFKKSESDTTAKATN